MSEVLTAGYPDDDGREFDLEAFLDEAETAIDDGTLSGEQMQILAEFSGTVGQEHKGEDDE